MIICDLNIGLSRREKPDNQDVACLRIVELLLYNTNNIIMTMLYALDTEILIICITVGAFKVLFTAHMNIFENLVLGFS